MLSTVSLKKTLNLLSCACVFLPLAAAAQEMLPGDYDCVIQPNSLVKLGTPDEGIIQKIEVERGDRVKKGAIVARLDSELQSLTVELAKLKAERDVDIRTGEARLQYRTRAAERALELSKKRIVAKKTLDEAETEKSIAEFGLKAAELDHRMAEMELKNARALLGRRTIRSPVNGIVVEVTMAAGEFAHKQSPLMTIAEADPLNVEVFLPISQYGTIQTGMIGEVSPEQPIGGKYHAKVSIVDRVFDTASSTFGVRLTLPNHDYRLPAGMKCRIRFLPMLAEAPIDNKKRGGVIAAIDKEKRSDAAPAPQLLQKTVVRPSAKDSRDTNTKQGGGAETPRTTVKKQALASAKSGKPNRKKRPSHANQELLRAIQKELILVGLNPGEADGQMRTLTREAIIAFQRLNGQKSDGQPSPALLSKLKDVNAKLLRSGQSTMLPPMR